MEKGGGWLPKKRKTSCVCGFTHKFEKKKKAQEASCRYRRLQSVPFGVASCCYQPEICLLNTHAETPWVATTPATEGDPTQQRSISPTLLFFTYRPLALSTGKTDLLYQGTLLVPDVWVGISNRRIVPARGRSKKKIERNLWRSPFISLSPPRISFPDIYGRRLEIVALRGVKNASGGSKYFMWGSAGGRNLVDRLSD